MAMTPEEKRRRRDREDRENENVLAQAEKLGIDPAKLSGKIIPGYNGNGKASAQSQRDGEREIGGLFSGMAAGIGILRDGINALNAVAVPARKIGSDKLAAPFEKALKTKNPIGFKTEDDEYIYDTAKVSEVTYRQLQSELAEIQTLQDGIEGLPECETELRLSRTQTLETLIRRYQLRPHPVTGVLVHYLERVEELEAEAYEHEGLHTRKHHKQDHRARIYYPRDWTHDSRQWKVILADVLDQDSAEVNASTSERHQLPQHTPQPE